MFLSLTAAGLAVVACNTYTTSLLEGPGSGHAADCHWGDCWWSTKTPQGCRDVSNPADSKPPAHAAGKDIDAIYLGMTKVYLGESAPPNTLPPEGNGAPTAGKKPYQFFGLDVDGLCTNPVSCAAAPKDDIGCTSASGVPADGQGCRDNVFAQIEPQLAADPELGVAYGINENDFDCELYRGGFNILFKISHYNGKFDDDQVRVDLYMSPGLSAVPSWKCAGGDAWKGEIAWLPSAPWLVDQAGLGGPVGPQGGLPEAKTANDPSAFVRDGYLVAHLQNGEQLRFIGDQTVHNGFALVLQQGLLTGRLFKNQDNVWAMGDALISGSIRKSDLEQSFNDVGFCDSGTVAPVQPVSAAEYKKVTDLLDSSTDVLANGANSKSAGCDALSVGIGFEALTVAPGPAVTVSSLQKCGPPKNPYTP
jgi:hypothetical protein